MLAIFNFRISKQGLTGKMLVSGESVLLCRFVKIRSMSASLR